MKKITVALIGMALLMLAPASYSDTLILSPNLKLNYHPPELLSHTQNALIFKYKDWYFMHEIVNPKTIYQKIDLTGIEDLYIKGIFDNDARSRLPHWLAVLAEEQSKEFGVKAGSIHNSKIGNAEITGTYNVKNETAHLYIFDLHTIHHLVVHGDHDNYSKLITNIEVR